MRKQNLKLKLTLCVMRNHRFIVWRVGVLKSRHCTKNIAPLGARLKDIIIIFCVHLFNLIFLREHSALVCVISSYDMKIALIMTPSVKEDERTI